MTLPPQTDQASRAKTRIIGWLGLALSLPSMISAQDMTGLSNGRMLDLSLHTEDLSPTRVVSQPDFSGTWRLDETRSDDPKQALNAAVQRPERSGAGRDAQVPTGAEQNSWLENTTSSSSGGGPSSGNRRRGGGRMGHAGGDRSVRNDPERLVGLFSQRLEILQQASMVTITTAPGRSRRIITDDRGASVTNIRGLGQGVTTGYWQGSTLILEIQSGDDQRIVQRFRLLAQPRRLELVTELPTQRQDGKRIEVTQVFIPHQQRPKQRASVQPTGS
ncbi:MAG: hypothetical protein C1943_15575 [Halochromatium sp.]|nr:hypothetical protein [Halochromatium sp.]